LLAPGTAMTRKEILRTGQSVKPDFLKTEPFSRYVHL